MCGVRTETFLFAILPSHNLDLFVVRLSMFKTNTTLHFNFLFFKGGVFYIYICIFFNLAAD